MASGGALEVAWTWQRGGGRPRLSVVGKDKSTRGTSRRAELPPKGTADGGVLRLWAPEKVDEPFRVSVYHSPDVARMRADRAEAAIEQWEDDISAEVGGDDHHYAFNCVAHVAPDGPGVANALSLFFAAGPLEDFVYRPAQALARRLLPPDASDRELALYGVLMSSLVLPYVRDEPGKDVTVPLGMVLRGDCEDHAARCISSAQAMLKECDGERWCAGMEPCAVICSVVVGSGSTEKHAIALLGRLVPRTGGAVRGALRFASPPHLLDSCIGLHPLHDDDGDERAPSNLKVPFRGLRMRGFPKPEHVYPRIYWIGRESGGVYKVMLGEQFGCPPDKLTRAELHPVPFHDNVLKAYGRECKRLHVPEPAYGESAPLVMPPLSDNVAQYPEYMRDRHGTVVALACACEWDGRDGRRQLDDAYGAGRWTVCRISDAVYKNNTLLVVASRAPDYGATAARGAVDSTKKPSLWRRMENEVEEGAKKAWKETKHAARAAEKAVGKEAHKVGQAWHKEKRELMEKALLAEHPTVREGVEEVEEGVKRVARGVERGAAKLGRAAEAEAKKVWGAAKAEAKKLEKEEESIESGEEALAAMEGGI